MVNDYAHLNREENLPVKKDLAKLITLLELQDINYWVISQLWKKSITTESRYTILTLLIFVL